MAEYFINVRKDKVSVPLAGKKYEIYLSWTFRDISDIFEIASIDEISSKDFIINKMRKSFDDERLNSLIEAASDEDISSFVSILVDSDETLRMSYEKAKDILYPPLRLVQSSYAYMAESMSKSLEAIRPKLEVLSDEINTVKKNIIEYMGPIIESVSKIAGEAAARWTESLGRIAESISQITFPDISEERKVELIDSHKMWGYYGWTYIPFAIDELFDEMPSDGKAADEKAMSYISKEVMNYAFEAMIEYHTMRRKDVDELRRCYNNRCYKSSCMLAFGMIDSVLIRSQKKSDNRKPGNSGIRKFEKKLKAQDLYKGIFAALEIENLLSCLNSLFEDSANFMNQPRTVNRHFIDHGMLIRNVPQKDAVKVILLAYNLNRFMNEIK